MVTRLNVAFDESDFKRLLSWKARYADSIGRSVDDVSWDDVLLAYAKSKVLP